MFLQSQFNQDLSQWNVSCFNDMTGIFVIHRFDQDLSR
jgi:hypothetical protein